MRVVDRWTTQYGRWYVSDAPYGIDQEHIDRYEGWAIPGKGADHHVLVHARPGTVIRFDSGGDPISFQVGSSRWINFPLFAGSAYKPDKGETGPWKVYADNVLVAEGIGLPGGQHVSTFLIVDEGEDVSQPPAPSKSHIVLTIDGAVVYDSNLPK